MKPEEEVLRIEGLDIFVRKQGRGEPFLILHGWGGSSVSWQKVQEKLSEKFLVIIPDLPGFGRSSSPKAGLDVQNYTDLVLALLKKMKIEREFYLLGHSFGAKIATRMAVLYPQRIKKLFLVDGALIKKKRFRYLSYFFRKFKIILGPLAKSNFFRKLFYKYLLKKTDYLEAKGPMKETFKLVISENQRDYCSKINIPTVIIWGEKDKTTPKKDAFYLKKIIKNSKLIFIKRAGHAPNLTHPDELVQIINQETKNKI